MPKVPTYDNLQATPTTLPNVQAQGALTPEEATVGTKQIEQAGNAVQSFGGEFWKAAELANRLRVDDGENQLITLEQKYKYDKNEGFTNLRGSDAMERPSGQSLTDEYMGKLQEGANKIRDSLGNDYQKTLFNQVVAKRMAGFQGDLMKHESQQFYEYGLSVGDGKIKNSMNEVGLNYNDPQKVDDSINSIKAAVYNQGHLLGKSAEWIEAQTREMTSKAHAIAVKTALENNNAQFADDYLKRNAKDMTADDILHVNGTLTKQLDAHLAASVADKVITQAMPTINTPESDRAFNIALNTESGGRQFASDGQPVTSPKGAVGIAQVMPTTGPEAAKLAGLEWDEEKFRTDANYNRTLGKAYFDQQLKDFGGSVAQAYAAYNAGPGATREAIQQAKDDGGDWLTYLPKETQDYVQKNMASYSAGEGTNTKPTLVDLQNQVRQQIGSSNPQRLKLALDEVERRFDDINKATKQRDDEAVANAYRQVEQNGGRYSDLPASVKGAIPPKEVSNVMEFAQRVAKGDNSTSLWLYNKLATDSGYLKSLSDDQFYKFRNELSVEDFKHFSDERAKLNGGNMTNGPGELNTSAIKQTIDNRLQTMGIDPTPKDGTNDAIRVGAIRKFINDNILASQASSGKKMNDAETSQFIDSLFAKNTTYDGIFFNSSGTALGMKVGDLPSPTRNALTDAFKRRGVDNPTDAQILNAYWMQISRK